MNCHMDIRLLFSFDELTIETKSLSAVTATQVKSEFYKKNRFSKEQALLFDVRFDFDSDQYDDDHFLLKAKMEIPACYQSLKGE